MGGAGRSYLFSPREKIEMRGPLATTTGYRSPPPSRSAPPPTPSPRRSAPSTFPPLGELKEGTRPRRVGGRAGGDGQRRAKAHRSPPPSPLSRWRPLRSPPAGSSMGGAERSCLFSPREKIEMRGPLATATGYRSPSPSRSVTPATQRPPLGEGQREEARWGDQSGPMPRVRGALLRRLTARYCQSTLPTHILL